MNSVNLARTLLTPKLAKNGNRYILKFDESLANQLAQEDASLSDLIRLASTITNIGIWDILIHVKTPARYFSIMHDETIEQKATNFWNKLSGNNQQPTYLAITTKQDQVREYLTDLDCSDSVVKIVTALNNTEKEVHECVTNLKQMPTTIAITKYQTTMEYYFANYVIVHWCELDKHSLNVKYNEIQEEIQNVIENYAITPKHRVCLNQIKTQNNECMNKMPVMAEEMYKKYSFDVCHRICRLIHQMNNEIDLLYSPQTLLVPPGPPPQTLESPPGPLPQTLELTPGPCGLPITTQLPFVAPLGPPPAPPPQNEDNDTEMKQLLTPGLCGLPMTTQFPFVAPLGPPPAPPPPNEDNDTEMKQLLIDANALTPPQAQIGTHYDGGLSNLMLDTDYEFAMTDVDYSSDLKLDCNVSSMVLNIPPGLKPAEEIKPIDIIEYSKRFCNDWYNQDRNDKNEQQWYAQNIPYFQPFQDCEFLSTEQIMDHKNNDYARPNCDYTTQDLPLGYVRAQQLASTDASLALEQQHDIVSVCGLDTNTPECENISAQDIIKEIRSTQSHNLCGEHEILIIKHSESDVVLEIMKTVSTIRGSLLHRYVYIMKHYGFVVAQKHYELKSISTQVWSTLKTQTKNGFNCALMLPVGVRLNEPYVISLRCMDGSDLAQGFIAMYVGETELVPEGYGLFLRKDILVTFEANSTKNKIQTSLKHFGTHLFENAKHDNNFSGYFKWCNRDKSQYLRHSIDFEPVCRTDLYLIHKKPKNQYFLVRAMSMWCECHNGYNSMPMKIQEEYDRRLDENKLQTYIDELKQRNQSVQIICNLLTDLLKFVENQITWAEVGNNNDDNNEPNNTHLNKLKRIINKIYTLNETRFENPCEKSYIKCKNKFYANLNVTQYNYYDIYNNSMIDDLCVHVDDILKRECYFVMKLGLEMSEHNTPAGEELLRKIEQVLNHPQKNKNNQHNNSKYNLRPISELTTVCDRLSSEIMFRTRSKQIIGIDRLKMWPHKVKYCSHHKHNPKTVLSKISNNTDKWLGPDNGIQVSYNGEKYANFAFVDRILEGINELKLLDTAIGVNNTNDLSTVPYYGVNNIQCNVYQFRDTTNIIDNKNGNNLNSHCDDRLQFNTVGTFKITLFPNDELCVAQTNSGPQGSKYTTTFPQSKLILMCLQCVFFISCIFVVFCW